MFGFRQWLSTIFKPVQLYFAQTVASVWCSLSYWSETLPVSGQERGQQSYCCGVTEAEQAGSETSAEALAFPFTPRSRSTAQAMCVQLERAPSRCQQAY